MDTAYIGIPNNTSRVDPRVDIYHLMAFTAEDKLKPREAAFDFHHFFGERRSAA